MSENRQKAPDRDQIEAVYSEIRRESFVLLQKAYNERRASVESLNIRSDTVNKNAFLSFLEFVLLPTLSEGSVIVMDNWSVHHGAEVSELVETYGCELL